MRFKNKKTGEIKDWDFGNWYQTILNPENKEKYECNLNDFIDRTVKFRDEWEDAPEEPVRRWIIDTMNDRVEDFDVPMEFNESIGNYFSSREEAELAVRKLKAWKRLKDKGFRITLRGCKGNAWLQANWGNLQGDYSDVLFLFGGGE